MLHRRRRKWQHLLLPVCLAVLSCGTIAARPMEIKLPKDLEASTTTTTSEKGDDAVVVPLIVNGEQADPGDYPYYVAMGTCGAVLIGPDLVLTAAHCKDRTDSELLIGAYRKWRTDGGAVPRFCDRWIQHPLYDEANPQDGYDVALCLLDRPVEIDPEARVRLELNEDPSVPAGGDEVTVIGMGQLEFQTGDGLEFLQYVREPALSDDVCGAVYDGLIDDFEGLLCVGDLAGGKGACTGDSGGPAVRRTIRSDGTVVDAHVGLVSFIVTPVDDARCAAANTPVVYTQTSAHIGWIRDTACADLGSVSPFCSPLNDPPEPLSCSERGEHEVTVEIRTGPNQGRYTSGWFLFDDGNVLDVRLVASKVYLVQDDSKEHVVCVGESVPYSWRLSGLDFLGTYSLSLNGEVLSSGFGNGSVIIESFETPLFEAPPPVTDSPTTRAPTKSPKKATKKQKKAKKKRRRRRRRNGP